MHNSFTVTESAGTYTATSHNFNISGSASTEMEAIKAMKRAVQYYADNDPVGFKKKIKERTDRGLECLCGVKLTEKPIGFYKGV